MVYRPHEGPEDIELKERPEVRRAGRPNTRSGLRCRQERRLNTRRGAFSPMGVRWAREFGVESYEFSSRAVYKNGLAKTLTADWSPGQLMKTSETRGACKRLRVAIVGRIRAGPRVAAAERSGPVRRLTVALRHYAVASQQGMLNFKRTLMRPDNANLRRRDGEWSYSRRRTLTSEPREKWTVWKG